MIAELLWRFFAVFFALATLIALVAGRNASSRREIAAYRDGYISGRMRGRDEGWLERNQQALDHERARRAHDGTFRSVRKEVSNG